jgi:hypothetical protein
VVAPDLDTLVARQLPGSRPTGPAAPRSAALAFTDTYLATRTATPASSSCASSPARFAA